MAEHYSSFTEGGRLWFVQRLTAAFLVIVLAFHFFLLHFVHHADEVTFLMSQARMTNLPYYSLMILFLFTATFHVAMGVDNEMVNTGLTGTKRTAAQAQLISVRPVLLEKGGQQAHAVAGAGSS